MGICGGGGFYNTATRPYVCLSVLVFPTRLSDRDQIGCAYANISGIGSNLKQFTPSDSQPQGGLAGQKFNKSPGNIMN